MRASVLVAAFAAGFAYAHAPSSASTHRRSQVKRASAYSLTGHYAGQDFLDLFNYDTRELARPPLPPGPAKLTPRPPHADTSNGGLALYATTSTASDNDLVALKDGKVHLRVHPKADDGKLQAIKLTSKRQYNEGLYIWDIERMPQVCVCPAPSLETGLERAS